MLPVVEAAKTSHSSKNHGPSAPSRWAANLPEVLWQPFVRDTTGEPRCTAMAVSPAQMPTSACGLVEFVPVRCRPPRSVPAASSIAAGLYPSHPASRAEIVSTKRTLDTAVESCRPAQATSTSRTEVATSDGPERKLLR